MVATSWLINRLLLCKQADIVLNASILNRGGKNLIIRNITIDKPINYGILQVGGTLDMQNVVIKGVAKGRTLERWQELDNEVALVRNACINLSGGALLRAKGIILVKNNLTAIRVDGENTKAVLSGVSIRDNKISQFFIRNPPLMCGAIEVANKGTLCIENSAIENNEYIGIYIHDNGKMHLRSTTVKGTKLVQDTTGRSLYGYNIFIASGATVELRSFVSSYAQGIGIAVEQAYLTAENGYVNNNAIGIWFFSNPANDPSYNPFYCIYDNVQFVDNVVRNGGMALPIPTSLNSAPDRSLCRIVPWN